jgi:hypothetical protein
MVALRSRMEVADVVIVVDPGTHELTPDRYDTDYVVATRILADPNAADLAAVHSLQD